MVSRWACVFTMAMAEMEVPSPGTEKGRISRFQQVARILLGTDCIDVLVDKNGWEGNEEELVDLHPQLGWELKEGIFTCFL